MGTKKGMRFGMAARVATALLFLLQFGYAALPPAAGAAAGAKSVGERFVTAGGRFQSETEFEINERRCPKAGPLGEIEGETYACGMLLIPENYDEPAGREIALTF